MRRVLVLFAAALTVAPAQTARAEAPVGHTQITIGDFVTGGLDRLGTSYRAIGAAREVEPRVIDFPIAQGSAAAGFPSRFTSRGGVEFSNFGSRAAFRNPRLDRYDPRAARQIWAEPVIAGVPTGASMPFADLRIRSVETLPSGALRASYDLLIDPLCAVILNGIFGRGSVRVGTLWGTAETVLPPA